MSVKTSVRKAAADYKYLLDRDYPKKASLDLVVNRYVLDKAGRNFLVRYVYTDKEIRDHKSKLVPMRAIRGRDVVVDGYNVLILAENILEGKEIVRGMDGFTKDLSAAFSSYRFRDESKKALDQIIEILSENKPASVTFVLDSQMSGSGALASLIREKLSQRSISGDAIAARNADYVIKKMDKTTLSSDSVIIGKVCRAVDAGRAILKRRGAF